MPPKDNGTRKGQSDLRWTKLPNGSLLCEGRGLIRRDERGFYFAHRGSLGWGPFADLDEAKKVLIDDERWKEEIFPQRAVALV